MLKNLFVFGGNMKLRSVLSLGLLIILLAGCASPYGLEQAAGTSSGSEVVHHDSLYQEQSSDYQSYNEAALGDFYQDPLYGVNVVGGPSSGAKDRVIYFSYDSTKIDARSENVIRQHANYLSNHPQMIVVLEGHTDERGSREYNIGLGERRGYSVKSYFERVGVNQQQIRVLSYGEERPAAWGSDELSYAKNRRVVIVY